MSYELRGLLAAGPAIDELKFAYRESSPSPARRIESLARDRFETNPEIGTASAEAWLADVVQAVMAS